jgi:hypothetical protein
MLMALVLSGTAATGAAAPITTQSRPGPTNVHAGPGANYGVVGTIAGGTTVEVIACLPPQLWCEVAAGQLRGWAAGPRLYLTGWWNAVGPAPYGGPLRNAGATYPPAVRNAPPLVPLYPAYREAPYAGGPVYK